MYLWLLKVRNKFLRWWKRSLTSLPKKLRDCNQEPRSWATFSVKMSLISLAHRSRLMIKIFLSPKPAPLLAWILWKSEVARLCPTLCDPMDCSLPGSFVHGIFQARVLEWVAISFSKGSSWPRGWTQVFCLAGRCFTIWATREAWIL